MGDVLFWSKRSQFSFKKKATPATLGLFQQHILKKELNFSLVFLGDKFKKNYLAVAPVQPIAHELAQETAEIHSFVRRERQNDWVQHFRQLTAPKKQPKQENTRTNTQRLETTHGQITQIIHISLCKGKLNQSP